MRRDQKEGTIGPNPRWARWCALDLGAALLVAVVAGSVQAVNVGLAANPKMRPAETWTVDDLRTIFFDRSLHWCGGHHGHVSGRGWWFRCKGKPAAVFCALRKMPRSRELDELAVSLLNDSDHRVVAWAAETAGIWKLDAAAGPLAARLDESIDASCSAREWDDERVEECASWALEQLGASSALPVLERREDRASGIRKHAIEVLERRLACPGCPAVHGRW
jgi:hypothetical protein